MEDGWELGFFELFSLFRNGIFIFGGFELGFGKRLGMQMTAAARLAAVIVQIERKWNAKPQAAAGGN